MARNSKPRVITRCVANSYTGPDQRIIEFAGKEDGHGGLISLSYEDDGTLYVYVYSTGAKVRVGSAREGGRA